jgi:hypothetical protein
VFTFEMLSEMVARAVAFASRPRNARKQRAVDAHCLGPWVLVLVMVDQLVWRTAVMADSGTGAPLRISRVSPFTCSTARTTPCEVTGTLIAAPCASRATDADGVETAVSELAVELVAAVPSEGVRARFRLARLAPDHPPGGVSDLEFNGDRSAVERVAPGSLAAQQSGCRGLGGDRLADVADRARQSVAALGRVSHRLEQVVGQQLLLYPGHLHQLLGEGVGVERRGRILVLQLRGQQRHEGVVAARESSAPGVDLGANSGGGGRERCGRFDGHAGLLRFGRRRPRGRRAGTAKGAA